MEQVCKCEWCNCKPNPSGKGYCRKHYDQMRKYGYILPVRSRCDKNRIVLCDDHAEIIITNSKDEYLATAIVDLDDVDRVSEYRWTLNDNGYVRTFRGVNPMYLHRFICSYDGELVIDHINRDKLDNRKSNLRIVSQTINNLNREVAGFCHTHRKLSKPYVVHVKTVYGDHYRKYFATEEEAREASIRVRSEFITKRLQQLNIPLVKNGN